MRTPKTQTQATLRARCVEEGTCLIWQGSINYGVPQCHHQGKCRPVRAVFSELLGKAKDGGAYGTKCGDKRCIAPEHIVHRDIADHGKHMSEVLKTMPALRVLGSAKSGRTQRKVSDSDLESIRNSEKSYSEIAKEFGISKSLVSRYRNGKSLVSSNIWRGLLR